MCRIDIIEYSYMLCIDIVGYIDIRSDLEMGIRMKNESPLLPDRTKSGTYIPLSQGL